MPFRPRVSDRWPVGGVAPQPLPAGRLSGRDLRLATPPAGPAIDLPRGRGLTIAPADAPILGPADVIPAQVAAAIDPGGLRREVFGFLPYWELTDSSTRLDWEKLSTIAYFGVGAAANGDLQRRNADGTTTVGWSGWTSSKLTSVINAAHASGARVVLTVQSFGWSSAGVDPPEGAARQRDRAGQPRPPDRGRRARPRGGRGQPRLRADRVDLRR